MRANLPPWWLRATLASFLLGLLAGWLLIPHPSRATDEALYFAATGQRLDNTEGFLGFWRAADGPRLLGAPVTGLLNEGGRPVQYFELGRLERHPDLEGAPILLGRVAAEYAETLWLSFPPPADRPAAGARLFSATGYAVGQPFLAFWQAGGGLDAFGYPIGDARWEYVGGEMIRVQYFERVRLEHRPALGAGPEAVSIAPLGRDLALLRGYSLAPADPAGAVAVNTDGSLAATPTPPPPPPTATAAPRPTAAPAPTAKPQAAPAPRPQAAPARSGKSIVVDIGDQWLYAFEGGEQVFSAPVSTGRDGFNTPIGTFAVYAKLRSQTMRGSAGGETWNVPNVPHVMYIVGGVALHGTYWHNQFGSGVRRSHGCINLPLKAAAWLYEWAPMGVPVTVRW